jgi:rfaE bifunctional protein kinase chain/domain/rfaE bifunctional protein nucleotidyltransferase chain/domain
MLLAERYAHKINDAETVRKAISGCRVVMCHGVFDVVHPGHLRHLMYARGLCDTLIVSITADRHVTKGPHRPHVPQELRAANLAAYEFVDYVVIDDNPTPIENIKLIKPNYFAKGFEYVANDTATKMETDAVRSYGGEMLFTPGDVVYSSSKLIEQARPSLGLDKLEMLMRRMGITFDDLRNTVGAMRGQTVHVVGDTIIDSYTHCGMVGSGTKTPTISAQFERRFDYVGGAAVVAKHCAAAGAKVTFSSVVGDDDHGLLAINDLDKAGVIADVIVDRSRPTTNKNAIVVNGYRVAKIDTVDNRVIGDNVLEHLCENVRRSADTVIFSDFRHGIFNKRTITALTDAIPHRSFKAADSQVASRWGNITEFQGFDLVTPNEREARFSLGDQDSGIRQLASGIFAVTKCGYLLMKLGERGMLWLGADDAHFFLDSFAGRVVDPVGAGDAMLAYASMARADAAAAVEEAPEISAILGNVAAGIECERDGNIPVTADDVIGRLTSMERELFD